MTDNPWVKFSQGHWTREPPTKPGEYPVRDSDGLGEYQRIIVSPRSDGKLVAFFGEFRPVSVWRGWWWSEPYPSLPECPKG